MSIRKYYIDIVEERIEGPVAFIIMFLLSIISLLYGLVVNLRNRLYQRSIFLKEEKADIPVVSVGNLTWGGTAKTSLVIFLAKALEDKKKAVLTRGYGIDEVELLRNSLVSYKSRVFSGKNRLGILRRVYADYDLAILDDGFQYRKLKKDLNILLVNGRKPFGNGWLLPRGKLREPLKSIERADLMVVMYKELEPGLMKRILAIKPDIAIFSGSYKINGIFDLEGNKQNRQDLATKRWACFSAIGYPEGFLSSLEEYGIRPAKEFVYPDHHNLTQKEFTCIEAECLEKKADALITTAKDSRRFKFSSEVPIFVLGVELVIKEEKLFKQRLAVCIDS